MSWHHQTHKYGRPVPLSDRRFSVSYKNSEASKTKLIEGKKADHLREKAVCKKTAFEQTHQENKTETYL